MGMSGGGFGLNLKQEVCNVTINNVTAGQNMVSGGGTFSNVYNNPPEAVIFSHWIQTDPYCDTILAPFVYGITTTGFSVKFKTAEISGVQNTFGTGTMIAAFFVIGN